jgi:hypothetical protein
MASKTMTGHLAMSFWFVLFPFVCQPRLDAAAAPGQFLPWGWFNFVFQTFVFEFFFDRAGFITCPFNVGGLNKISAPSVEGHGAGGQTTVNTLEQNKQPISERPQDTGAYLA